MCIESFESRSPDEWVDLIKTLNREKLEPGAVSCRNWQSRKLGFREPELTRRVESLYLIVRAGDEREREERTQWTGNKLLMEQISPQLTLVP